MRTCNNNVKLCSCTIISIGSHSLLEYQHEFFFITPTAFLCDNKADQWQVRWASTCACVRDQSHKYLNGGNFPSACICTKLVKMRFYSISIVALMVFMTVETSLSKISFLPIHKISKPLVESHIIKC
uniref:Uncharacterized protein n=1 Tax=Glossina palpalis gambiensis TaxID=67801 RepID=A0A1B0B2L9_9MUSC